MQCCVAYTRTEICFTLADALAEYWKLEFSEHRINSAGPKKRRNNRITLNSFYRERYIFIAQFKVKIHVNIKFNFKKQQQNIRCMDEGKDNESGGTGKGTLLH